MSYRVLCVEDNPEIGRLLTESLVAADYACDWVRDGEAALALLGAEAAGVRYDLVTLDLMLPGMDGLEVCRRLRRQDNQTPVLMVTAKAAIRDVVVGLEIGADDYVTKPFAMPILLARIQALLRRDQRQAPSDDGIVATPPLVCGPLVIDADQHRVLLDDNPLQLTGKEFALLSLFARHPGRSFSRGELLDHVWGEEFDGYDHTVNTHINRLRNKIEADPARPRFIQTVWGVGYRFAATPESPGSTSPAPGVERP
ncbi:response regulator transcription factor [Halomonas heilongjiangensis]|uniref:Phosphate regulon transcriptional regulatory protein PhoB n=1 Tax=Halomonas heilongjiangensis TaxID=1387883 RepID=A0A2N7TQK2_9GAMM|nr:response regulator transcription factor [Halomonas heilongjiangensis]PMR70474.1 DNA-binding response regulator [Halomonas heilongjiangensis]PXX94589.1 DNA-binding response regulator [Halomonas heilongjiangensis]